ncbi:universal stress protein [Sandarakinorhabdus oryzae]|uniref:universal stress protein n=1 Tax=Sandarakinorhabdus oryzae TaxID=2675220 RepID=UPI0012E32D81|nr:universal stress protein [Sandarakinorhabdus oryzae]
MKTILVHIEGDEGQESRLAAAFDLARAGGGHLVCLSVMPYAAYALGDPAMGAFPVTTLIDAVEARRHDERRAVEARLATEGVSWEWHAADGDASDRLVEYARLADVVVMSAGPFARLAGMQLGITGDVAVRAPAPVLAVPQAARGLNVCGPALIGWDGSQEAATALRAALPMLALSEAVTLLTVEEKDSPFTGRAAAAYLSRHGVNADVVERGQGSASVEQVIRSVAAERQAAWIVQGAYGHSRMRQMLFGGVTRGLLLDAPVPILLAH